MLALSVEVRALPLEVRGANAGSAGANAGGAGRASRLLVDRRDAGFGEDGIEQALDLGGSRQHASFQPSGFGPDPEELVGQIQGGDDRNSQRIRGGDFASGGAHPIVQVAGQLGDVLRVQLAADGVALTVDVEMDDARGQWSYPRLTVRG